MFSFRKPKKTLLGVDISSNSVKVLEISQENTLYSLEAYGIEPTPPDSVVENTITDPEAVGLAIERAVLKSGSTSTEAACAIAGSKAITKKITLPSEVSEQDLEGQVQLEMVQHIPHPIEDISIDFQIENNPTDSGTPYEITVVATKSENVDSCVVALEKAGLTPRIVDVELFALENAISLASLLSREDKSSQVMGVIDMGSSSTKLSVFENGSINYNREQNFGGKQLLNEIQRSYGLSYEEAKAGLAESSFEPEYEEKTLAPFVESAAQEVERAIQLFYSSSNASRLEHISLTGGCAGVEGMVESISAKTDTSVDIINPFNKISVADRVDKMKLKQESTMLLTAFGLSARGVVF